MEFRGLLFVQVNLFHHVVLPLEQDLDVLLGLHQRLVQLQPLLREVRRHLGTLKLGLVQLGLVQLDLM